MSESGFTQFPKGPNMPGSSTRTAAGQGDLNASLIGVPNDLRDVRQPVKLRGEIIDTPRPDTLRIRTEKGNVDVRVEQRAPPQNSEQTAPTPSAQRPLPQRGQQVEIIIQPGTPPQKARVTSAPPQSDSRTRQTPPQNISNGDIRQRGAASSNQSSKADNAGNAVRSTQTPVNISVGQNPASSGDVTFKPALITSGSGPASLPLPDAGAIVRLQPVTAQQIQLPTAQNIISSTLTNTIQSTDFALQIIFETTAPKNTDTLIATQTSAEQTEGNITGRLFPLYSASLLTGSASAALPQIFGVQGQAALPPDNAGRAGTFSPGSPVDVSLTAPPKIVMPLAGSSFSGPSGVFGPENLPYNGLSSSQDLSFFTVRGDSAGPQITQTRDFQNLQPLAARLAASEQTQNFVLRIPLDIRIDAILPPDVVIDAPAANAQTQSAGSGDARPVNPLVTSIAAGGSQGVIIGKTENHNPVMRVFDPGFGGPQNFALQVPAEDVLPGTRIQFTTLSQNQTVQGLAGGLQQSLQAFLQPGLWPALQESLQTLAQVNTPAAASSVQSLSNIMPGPATPAQMTPAALFFIAAMRGMDLGGWLGERSLDILRREGRPGLLNRLGQDSALLSRLGGEPVSQDWRALTLPMMWENEIHKAVIYYRQEQREGNTDRQKGKQSRFIFDLSLSHMGDVQIDGLFRPGRLDVILRTEQLLSQAMQQDMRRLYTKILKETTITGELSFQNQPEQWVRIIPDEETLGVHA